MLLTLTNNMKYDHAYDAKLNRAAGDYTETNTGRKRLNNKQTII